MWFLILQRSGFLACVAIILACSC
uniref:Uncharacterized protein n=1 Tax=Rhizophora mucronata TaxID=61149 RepID=A0A2P2QXY6_RHIMU